MTRRWRLRVWMMLLLGVLLAADAVLIGLATTILVAIYSATAATLSTGDSVQWEPNVADVVATAVDGLTSPWAVAVLVVLAGQIWLLLRAADETELTADASADDDLAARTRRLAQQVDVVPPDVRVVDAAVPNSFVVGRTGDATVYVTRALRDRLSDEQLDAVLAHELAHVKNRDVTVTTIATNAVPVGRRVVGLSVVGVVVGLLGLLVLKIVGGVGATIASLLPTGLLAGVPGPDLFFLALTAVGALLLATAAISVLLLVTFAPIVLATDPVARRFGWAREYAADDGAVEILGSPVPLASALQELADAEPPDTDPREDWNAVQAFCVVSLEPTDDSTRADDDTDGGGSHGSGSQGASDDSDGGSDDGGSDEPALGGWPTEGTHPPIAHRIERLRERTY